MYSRTCIDIYVTFNEQQKCVYDFSSISLATRASADMSEAHMAKNCDGKSNTHACCSWKVIS